MSIIKKIVKILIIVIVLSYFTFGLFLFIFQKNFIYQPDKQNFISCKRFEDSEKININGTRAYYKRNSNRLIVFYHGNGGSACMRSYLKDEFEKLGFSFIFVEYAGYSDDTRKASKVLIMKDVENIKEFTEKQNFSKIIVAGESLGTALAIYHSTISNVDNLLLISPFNSLADIAGANYRIYPITLMFTENYDSNMWIRTTKAKNIEIIHGTQDKVVSIEQSKKLFNEIKISNKKFVEIEGAHHNDIYNFSKTTNEIDKFLSE